MDVRSLRHLSPLEVSTKMGPVANRARVSREGKEARPGAEPQRRGCRPAVQMEGRFSVLREQHCELVYSASITYG